MVLQRRDANAQDVAFSVWDRNIQLALYSVAIYLPTACLETGGNVLRGWTHRSWGIACLHAAGGILVALSVLYTSSITKTGGGVRVAGADDGAWERLLRRAAQRGNHVGVFRGDSHRFRVQGRLRRGRGTEEATRGSDLPRQP